MKLLLPYILAILFFSTCILYLGSVILGHDSFSEMIRSFIAPLLLCCYFIKKENKSFLMTMFLVFYSIAETSFLYIEFSDLSYYIGNISYSLAYGFMLVFIIKKLEWSRLLKRFSIHLIILSIFGAYLMVSLNELPEAEISDNKFLDYFLYTIYNLLFTLVLIFSLLNYLFHDIMKALILFLACFSIVLSELVQVAYVVEIRTLFNVVYSALLVLGFILLFVYFNHGHKARSIDLEVGVIGG